MLKRSLISYEEARPLLIAAAPHHFWAFCCLYDWEFFRIKRRFLKEPALLLQQVYEGKLKHIFIALPPRSGKSYMMSLFAAWFIGNKPEQSIMRSTCTTHLYNKFSYDTRDIIRSHEFKLVFPTVKLSEDKQAIASWNVKQARQVTYFGSGVGGTIIGFGADGIAITDDLYKSIEDALSDNYNEKVQQWYQSTYLSRLESGCPQVDIGTRWRKNDIIGQKVEDGKYDGSYIQPALIDNESFCNDVKTTEEYIDLKDTLDDYIWFAEFMQEPIDLKGVLFPRSELLFYDDYRKDEAYSIVFIDTADEGDDYFCAVFGDVIGKFVFVYDVIFNQEDLTYNEPLLLGRLIENKTKYVVVETNSAGAYFRRNIQVNTPDTSIYGQFNTANKHARIITMSGIIKKYFKFRNDQNLEYQKYVDNLTTYMRTKTSKHDDAADATAGLANYIMRAMKTWMQ